MELRGKFVTCASRAEVWAIDERRCLSNGSNSWRKYDAGRGLLQISLGFISLFRNLFSDAKIAKDVIKNVVGIDFTQDRAQFL